MDRRKLFGLKLLLQHYGLLEAFLELLLIEVPIAVNVLFLLGRVHVYPPAYFSQVLPEHLAFWFEGNLLQGCFGQLRCVLSPAWNVVKGYHQSFPAYPPSPANPVPEVLPFGGVEQHYQIHQDIDSACQQIRCDYNLGVVKLVQHLDPGGLAERTMDHQWLELLQVVAHLSYLGLLLYEKQALLELEAVQQLLGPCQFLAE